MNSLRIKNFCYDALVIIESRLSSNLLSQDREDSSMKLERASRYKDKLNLISKRAGQIDDWLSQAPAEDFLEELEAARGDYSAPSRLARKQGNAESQKKRPCRS